MHDSKNNHSLGVLDQICGQFECHHFIANVTEESERCNRLVRLREMILSEILEEHADFRTPNISQFNKDRLKCKKVLIILDDKWPYWLNDFDLICCYF